MRSELFNVEQLERHAKTLAASHQLATGRGTDKLIARLNENESILVQTYELVTEAAKRKRRNSPAAEWLLDNFYLIEEQIRTARRHLPPSYSRELPRLAERPGGDLSAGLRHCPGPDLSRRRACGRRQPQQLHRRLPDRYAAEARRAVGGADHAAPGADREPAARGGADGRAAAAIETWPPTGPSAWCRWSSRIRPT